MTTEFKLGALDFCKVFRGMKPVDAIWETLELAQTLEAFGYSRYWLSEHHVPDVAHASPELLVPVVAGVTKQIRVGVAGVLLRYYNPLKVSNDFRLLDILFNGRVDLGIARGAVPPLVMSSLLEGIPIEVPFEKKVRDLVAYLRGVGNVKSIPFGPRSPEVWMLGTTTRSMSLASECGTNFCLGLFLPPTTDTDASGVVAQYRAQFQGNAQLAKPTWSVAVAGVCAPTDDLARDLVSGAGNSVYPSVVGSQRHCREAFERLRDVYETNEFIFLDVCQKYKDREKSYGLLAEALL